MLTGRIHHYWLGPDLSVPAFGGSTLVRIGENARRSVIFFGVPDHDGGIKYAGTGFLCAQSEDGLHFRYLVTARHVAKALEGYAGTGFFIRANKQVGGGAQEISIDHIEWSYHPDETVDLAATPFGFPPMTFDHIFYDLDNNVFDYRIPLQVVCGDAVSLVGLFRLHYGKQRNVPIVHSGHVATLPDPNEMVPVRDRITKKINACEVYLVEAQTLEGLSGSPVFTHAPVELTSIDVADQPEKMHPKAFGPVRLLGIYTGAWDGEPGTILASDRSLSGSLRVPVGVGTVVPGTKLLELLRDDPKMKILRENSKHRHAEERAATTDSAIPNAQASDENPKHREDFNSLLGAATRKQKSDD